MIPRIYVDTSVIGGCLDDEFAEWSNLLFKEFKTGIKTAVISDLTLRELEIAPDKVRTIISKVYTGVNNDLGKTKGVYREWK